ncbi:hypothetical protein GCM10010994_24130 [Chelatococcus reniformis]|uniref:SCP domain-containing protein n=2 Tax=Chelatococcus reniformis TaxID=1494448 RepID=A0A916UBA3_9HYPH|nr:hypothetical protein GCM10010994_24130 [Chelatococcus reniformis]
MPRHARPRLLAVLLLSMGLTHCALDAGRRVPPEQITVSTADAAEAATLISRYRTTRGLNAVISDADLNRAAAEQVRAVAERGKLSHGDFSGRMAAYAIAGSAAENLSAGSDTVSGAVVRWQRSPRHNDNLLMKEARRVGLAKASTPGQGYGTYWALVLAQ